MTQPTHDAGTLPRACCGWAAVQHVGRQPEGAAAGIGRHCVVPCVEAEAPRGFGRGPGFDTAQVPASRFAVGLTGGGPPAWLRLLLPHDRGQ